jgi:hypothetical protein
MNSLTAIIPYHKTMLAERSLLYASEHALNAQRSSSGTSCIVLNIEQPIPRLLARTLLLCGRLVGAGAGLLL